MGQVLTHWCLWQYSWLWLDLPSWGLEADMSLVGCYSKIWRIIRISKKKYKLYASNTHGCMCSIFCGVISIVAQLVLNVQTTRSWNQENSTTTGSAETCPTEGQGHLAHGTPSGVPGVEFVRDSWLTFWYLKGKICCSWLVKPRPSTFPLCFPAWRPVSFCQGINSILNFQAAKAAKAGPVTIDWQRLCNCQILKHLKLDSSKEVSSFFKVFSSFPIERWRICFCLFWVRNIGQLNQELALTPKERAMQKYAHTPRCSKLVFLDSTCSAWMQISCISYGGIVPPTRGLLMILNDV